uniref:Alanine racemase N-terminal domain-containing protein n=1 Tax=Neobodo designis TaxID=312471 RepID=A0A7S1QFD9_NEODS
MTVPMAAVVAAAVLGATVVAQLIVRRRVRANQRMRRGRLVASHIVNFAEQIEGPCPRAIVDLDAFDENVRAMVTVAEGSGKRVRVATKSVRCVDLLVRMLDVVPAGRAAGLMTFSAAETLALARDPRIVAALARHWKPGQHSQLLLAYPVADEASADLLVACQRELMPKQLSVAVMVDDSRQVDVLASAAKRAGIPLSVWIDVDMSLRPLPFAHLGVRRSPLRTPSCVRRMLEKIAGDATTALIVCGLMGYEAQVAGLVDFEDSGVASLCESFARSVVKRLSKRDGHARRQECFTFLRQSPVAHRDALCNGGGSGSLNSTVTDPSVSEVTVGSGALCGHLFDRYLPTEAPPFQPALYFALRVTRQPAANIFTCHGGGWCASGQPGASRLPLLVWPQGDLISMEGAGEVQTPFTVRTPPSNFGVGSVALFRPCKSGELGDTIAAYALVSKHRETVVASTYRGDGLEAWNC